MYKYCTYNTPQEHASTLHTITSSLHRHSPIPTTSTSTCPPIVPLPALPPVFTNRTLTYYARSKLSPSTPCPPVHHFLNAQPTMLSACYLYSCGTFIIAAVVQRKCQPTSPTPSRLPSCAQLSLKTSRWLHKRCFPLHPRGCFAALRRYNFVCRIR